MIAQANVTHLVIGKDDNLATTGESRDDLIAGQIGIFLAGSVNANGASALTAGQRFSIVYRKVDGELLETPVMEYDNLSNKNAVSTTAAATQATLSIGFNGTAGSIAVTNSEDYVVHYKWFDDTKTFGYGKPNKFIAYRSDASATQVEIADGLAANANLNSKREKPTPVMVATVHINNAGVAITGTGNLTAVNGSKFLTAATDADAVLSVGDYVRLGTAAGAALTDPVYKVASFPSGGQFIELESEFQGASATYTEANCDYIAAATAASADAGVVMTAQAQPTRPGHLKYSQTNLVFDLIGDGLGATDTGETTATKGVGTYEEISEVEWFLRGNRGESWRVGNYERDYTPDAVSGKAYQLITFDYFDDNAKTVDRKVNSFGTVLIATEDESASTVHTNLQTVFGI